MPSKTKYRSWRVWRRWLRSKQTKALQQNLRHRLEFMAALSLGLNGLWLIQLREPLSYQWMSTIMPLWVWGLILIFFSAINRLGIYRDSRRLRQIGMLSVFFARVFLLSAVAYGTQWRSNTIPEHLSWLIISLWAYWRIDAEAKYAA